MTKLKDDIFKIVLNNKKLEQTLYKDKEGFFEKINNAFSGKEFSFYRYKDKHNLLDIILDNGNPDLITYLYTNRKNIYVNKVLEKEQRQLIVTSLNKKYGCTNFYTLYESDKKIHPTILQELFGIYNKHSEDEYMSNKTSRYQNQDVNLNNATKYIQYLDEIFEFNTIDKPNVIFEFFSNLLNNTSIQSPQAISDILINNITNPKSQLSLLTSLSNYAVVMKPYQQHYHQPFDDFFRTTISRINFSNSEITYNDFQIYESFDNSYYSEPIFLKILENPNNVESLKKILSLKDGKYYHSVLNKIQNFFDSKIYKTYIIKDQLDSSIPAEKKHKRRKL